MKLYNQIIFFSILVFSLNAFSAKGVNETARETANEVEEISKDAWDETKRSYQATKNQVCEMVRGEEKCVAKDDQSSQSEIAHEKKSD